MFACASKSLRLFQPETERDGIWEEKVGEKEMVQDTWANSTIGWGGGGGGGIIEKSASIATSAKLRDRGFMVVAEGVSGAEGKLSVDEGKGVGVVWDTSSAGRAEEEEDGMLWPPSILVAVSAIDRTKQLNIKRWDFQERGRRKDSQKEATPRKRGSSHRKMKEERNKDGREGEEVIATGPPSRRTKTGCRIFLFMKNWICQKNYSFNIFYHIYRIWSTNTFHFFSRNNNSIFFSFSQPTPPRCFLATYLFLEERGRGSVLGREWVRNFARVSLSCVKLGSILI
jgi:hypothetical protein